MDNHIPVQSHTLTAAHMNNHKPVQSHTHTQERSLTGHSHTSNITHIVGKTCPFKHLKCGTPSRTTGLFPQPRYISPACHRTTNISARKCIIAQLPVLSAFSLSLFMVLVKKCGRLAVTTRSPPGTAPGTTTLLWNTLQNVHCTSVPSY